MGKEPFFEVNLLMAICWLVSAWELNVLGITLANCFTKSRVIPSEKERLHDDKERLRQGMRPGIEKLEGEGTEG